MKNSKIIIPFFLILVVLAVGAYMLLQNNIVSESMVKSDEMSADKDLMSNSKKDEAMMKDESEKMDSAMQESRYVEYDQAALANNENKRRVLFFYANWCPTCRPADANFKTNIDKIPDDAILIRVNYKDSETDQQEKDLAELYGITYQHTFVQIDEQGKEIAKWNGGQIVEFLANIK